MQNWAFSPKLDVCSKAPPLRHRVISVQLINLFYAEMTSSCPQIGSSKITPRCAHDDLISDCKNHDNKNADDILEEVVGIKASTALEGQG